VKPTELILRCYGEKQGDIWVAVCLDLNLAAQGHSLPEVKKKLSEQISEYLYDALEGEDKEYADQLLTRKAPMSLWVKYYAYRIICGINDARKDICSTFNQAMPLKPLDGKA